MEEKHYPIVDWPCAIKLVGHNKDIAEEIFTLFVKNLPAEHREISLAHQAENYPLLKQLIHRMHGALCYCGLPRIKSIVVQLEFELKNHIIDNLSSLMANLEHEVCQLLAYTRNRYLE